MEQIRCGDTFKRLFRVLRAGQEKSTHEGIPAWEQPLCTLTHMYTHTHMHTHTLPDTEAVGPQSLLRLVPGHTHHGRTESVGMTVPQNPFP